MDIFIQISLLLTTKNKKMANYIHWKVRHKTWHDYLKSTIWDMTKNVSVTSKQEDAVELGEKDAEKIADILNTLEGRKVWEVVKII